MKAVCLNDWGIENISLQELPDPSPAAGELLIRTEAATINPADLGMASGAMASWLPDTITAPYVPGWDLAGTVAAVGDGVDPSLVGRRAVGFSNWVEAGRGTQASLVALPLANVAIADGELPSAQLTTVSLNGLTAWAAVKQAMLEPGQTLVVAGAAGSVGGFAVQLAAARNIRVIAAVAEEDRELVTRLGASGVAAREDGDLGDVVRQLVPDGVDALFDTTPNLGAAGVAAIKDGGLHITSTTPPDTERGVKAVKIFGLTDANALDRLVAMALDGRLDTPVARQFEAAQAREAYETFAQGVHRGRVVLTF